MGSQGWLAGLVAADNRYKFIGAEGSGWQGRAVGRAAGLGRGPEGAWCVCATASPPQPLRTDVASCPGTPFLFASVLSAVVSPVSRYGSWSVMVIVGACLHRCFTCTFTYIIFYRAVLRTGTAPSLRPTPGKWPDFHGRAARGFFLAFYNSVSITKQSARVRVWP